MKALEELKSAELIEEPGQLITRLQTILAEKKAAGSNVPSPIIRQDDEGNVVISKGGSILVPASGVPDLQIPDIDRAKALASARGMEWREEYKDRMVPYFASDERVDGHGDIVRQSWIMDEFEKNSPLPYSHEWWAPPVGRAIDWSVVQRSEEDYAGPALWILGLFATKEDWEWADTVFRLVKSGFLPSGSVGFWSNKVIDVKDEEERSELGLGRWGLIFEENHLLEFSPTTIPANEGAHSIAASLQSRGKELQPRDVTLLRELVRRDVGSDRQAWIDSESAILHIAKSIWPDERWEFHREQDVPLTLESPPPAQAHARTRTRKEEPQGKEEGAPEPVEGEPNETVAEPDVSARLGVIERSVSHIAKKLDEFAAETTQVFSDLRELLESLPSKGSGEEADGATEDALDEAVSSFESVLENLKKLKS